MDFFIQHAAAIFLILGLIIIGLSGYLTYLLVQIRRRNKAADIVQSALDETNQLMHEQRLKSIEMICRAAQHGDCELSEACIRVKKLLEYYPGLEQDPHYRAIQAMYTDIEHFDTHDSRRALSRKEMQSQDRERLAIEGRYRELVLDSFDKLIARTQNLQGSRFDIAEAQGNKAANAT